jgi:hypothetical protein
MGSFLILSLAFLPSWANGSWLRYGTHEGMRRTDNGSEILVARWDEIGNRTEWEEICLCYTSRGEPSQYAIELLRRF